MGIAKWKFLVFLGRSLVGLSLGPPWQNVKTSRYLFLFIFSYQKVLILFITPEIRVFSLALSCMCPFGFLGILCRNFYFALDEDDLEWIISKYL